MKTLTTLQASNLATAYHNAMNMVNDPRHPYHPTTSPQQVLERYLKACKVCGVTMHNDHWEARAKIVVDELTRKRREAWDQVLKAGASL